MGHQSLVYGVIETLSVPPDRALAATEANRQVLTRLPESDKWPFLVQSMFSISQSRVVNIEYATTVIHFGASYKDLEEEWADWLAKFESLLFQLQGITAVVRLESERFGSHKMEWGAKSSSLPSVSWEFLGGPRTYEALRGHSWVNKNA